MSDSGESFEKARNGGGYGYQGNDGGYGGGDYGESGAHRTLHDYLLILRERFWYIIVVFVVVFAVSLVYTLTRTKLYQATATVEILRRDPMILPGQRVTENEIRTTEDLNTQVRLLESTSLVKAVVERLTDQERKSFALPYLDDAGKPPESLVGVMEANRKIVPMRLSLVLQVQYTHPDPDVAARVANLFVDEFMNYNIRQRMDASMKAVEDLAERADGQRKKVEELAFKLQRYREQNNLVSLDQRKDIVTEKLKALNLHVTQLSNQLKDAEIRWKQVQEYRETGKPLTDLTFIANQPLISQLLQQVAAQKIAIAQLRERYRGRHPTMIEAANSLTQIEAELAKALGSTAANIESEYSTAVRYHAEASAALKAQEQDSLHLDRFAVDYQNNERELLVNEELLQTILTRMRETSMTTTLDSQNARLVDRAEVPRQPFSPNVPLNLGLGLVGGVGMGLAFAFFVAFIDDRVKSSFDIEAVIGVPLVGIIPQIRRMEQVDKAQIVMNNADRQVSEAFLTLHSSLRLKDESKSARCFLITSTIPGEGKSFVSTNLALTFAAHGERTVVVDCDLRKPNIHRSFQLENRKGVIDICSGTATLEEATVTGKFPNLDIIPAGGRAKNPTHILNSKNFEEMLGELRKRYDRIFIDTPPLAAVSDAMIILPLVDGSIFTVFFNRVRRKAAQFAARKLLETNVPTFGAVLNGLNLAVSGYYYAQYYDKSYKDYYLSDSKDDSEALVR